MREHDDLLVEWDDRSNDWFKDDEVDKLCREEIDREAVAQKARESEEI